MPENKEKRYVSDNAQLMAEWDLEKNNELNFDPKKLTLGSGQKYGGNATKDTNGKRRYAIEPTGVDVHIVQEKKF